MRSNRGPGIFPASLPDQLTQILTSMNVDMAGNPAEPFIDGDWSLEACRFVNGDPARLEVIFTGILGVPVALLGLLYFVAIGPLHVPAAWRSESGLLRRARVGAAVAGILMVLYLIYTELFTLDALCLWCTAVHGITFLLFVVTLVGTIQMEPTLS